MKKIIRMAAMLAVAGAALLTSCTKDYSGDIKDLQDKVSALSKTVDAIQGQVNNGAILTAVNKTANGIQVVTTNGSYDITNGKDGNNGTVWTIGEDGFWYCDGKKSDYAKGSTVTVKDGVLYVDGQATEIASKGITAVWNEEKAALELYGVEGGQGDNGYVCISLDGKMKSLVFDPKAYVDGVEAILVKTFEYSPLKNNKKLDSKDEAWTADTTTVQVSPATVAEYFVNPKSAVITAEDALEFVVNANDEYIKTRAEASKDFDVKAEFVSYEAGKLKVNVTVNGVPATEELISVVALKVTPAEDADAAVVSDFAVVASSDLEDLAIADPKAEAKKKAVPQEDEHYRTVLGAVDADAYNQTIAWTPSDSMDDAKATCDTVVVYNQTLDLKGVVAAHKLGENACAEATAEQLEALGLTWDFAIVKNYKVGNPATDQADFIALSADGILTPKVFETAGKASIGRTPIVRVKLMHGTDVVKVAYVKVMIVDESEIPAETPKYELDVFETPTSNVIGSFEFACGEADTVYTNVEQMNVKIYNDLKMSKDVFHSIYTEFVDIQDSIVVDGKKVATVGLAKEYEAPNTEVEATHSIMWIVSNEDLWDVEGETLYHDVKYVGANGAEVLIRLKADVNTIKKSYDVAAPDYIKEYWNAEKTITYANVRTPDLGESDPANCVFVADLNAPFVTKDGKLLLNEAITDFEYYFCEKDIVKIKKIGDLDVVFAVSENGLELSAALVEGKDTTAFETIATIVNGNQAVPFNTITLNKASEIAKTLLNVADGKKVDGLYTYIGVTGYVCDNEDRPVQVTFQGQDHYRMNFLRPINIGTESADNFIDGVDFGEDGSYIEVKKLINPYDWRGRYFNKVEVINKEEVEVYANYWGYYGQFEVEVDTENIECDLNGKRQALPATIKVEQVETVAGIEPASEYGYITYRNNGNNVDKFNMFIKVKVTYGWGEILSDEIKVPVESTIGVDENN